MKLSINTLIPTILLLSSLVGGGLLYIYELSNSRKLIYKESAERIRHDVNRLQNILYTNVTEGDVQNARLNLSITAMDKSIKYIALIDEANTVLLANRYHIENKSAIGYKEFNPVISSSVINNKKFETYTSDINGMLYAYFPVKLPADKVTGNAFDKIGVIYVEYSLKHRLLRSQQQTTNKSILYGIFIFFIALIISLLLHQLITKRLNKLIFSTSSLAEGDFSIRVPVKGSDELCQLGTSFNLMAKVIEDNILLKKKSEKELLDLNNSLELRSVELNEALHEKGEQERIIRVALSGSGTGIFTFDFSTRYLFWDDKSLEMFSVSKDDFGFDFNSWSSLVHKDDVIGAVSEFNKNVDDKTISNFTLKYRIGGSDKSIRYIRAEFNAERDKEGIAVKLFGLHFDDTKVKQDEEQLKASRYEAEFANKTKSEFLANMSHEVRTPLNGILGVLHLIYKTELTEKQFRYIDIADKSANILLNIINDILDFSKIESGKMELESISFNLSDLLEDVYKLMSINFKNDNVDFIIHNNIKTIDDICGDPTRLRQVVMNLISNANKFTESGKVELFVDETDNNEVIVGVKDTGIGVSKEQQKNIFESFNQADSSHTRKYGGTGLGLNICQYLLKEMGSRLGFESEVNQGSYFYFKLPIKYSGNKSSNEDKVQVLSSKPESSLTFTDTPLLLVEDNDINQLVALEILEDFGFDIDVVDNGEKAVNAVQNKKYKIVLMDIQMPILDGIQAAKQIRALGGEHEDLPIIAMTANAIKGDSDKSINAGMNGHISKPFAVDELLQNIMKWVKPDNF